MKSLPSGLMIQDTREDVSLQVKLADCCERFKVKFGTWPTTVWLHSQTLGNFVSDNGLKLVTRRDSQPNVFLVGPLPERGG